MEKNEKRFRLIKSVEDDFIFIILVKKKTVQTVSPLSDSILTRLFLFLIVLCFTVFELSYAEIKITKCCTKARPGVRSAYTASY